MCVINAIQSTPNIYLYYININISNNNKLMSFINEKTLFFNISTQIDADEN